MTLSVIILAYQEERHITRAIASVTAVADRIYVIDSGSTDQTVALAEGLGATVLHNPWINHATQFNWALDQLPPDTDWVMRLDADEIVSDTLADQIASRLGSLAPGLDGVFVGRRMRFIGEDVRRGGVFPIQVLRLFRYGKGRCENRWMDEHIVVDGETTRFGGEIVDDNLSSLSWWTDKHNAYASREVVDVLNQELRFMPQETIAELRGGTEAGFKRWLKEKVYKRLPAGTRAMLYFFYRYVLRLGMFDTKEGRHFHVLQGFWYRYLVDAKLYEVRKAMRMRNLDAPSAIKEVLGIDLKL